MSERCNRRKTPLALLALKMEDEAINQEMQAAAKNLEKAMKANSPYSLPWEPPLLTPQF